MWLSGDVAWNIWRTGSVTSGFPPSSTVSLSPRPLGLWYLGLWPQCRYRPQKGMVNGIPGKHFEFTRAEIVRAASPFVHTLQWTRLLSNEASWDLARAWDLPLRDSRNPARPFAFPSCYFQTCSFYFIIICLNQTGNRLDPSTGAWDVARARTDKHRCVPAVLSEH